MISMMVYFDVGVNLPRAVGTLVRPGENGN